MQGALAVLHDLDTGGDDDVSGHSHSDEALKQGVRRLTGAVGTLSATAARPQD